MSAMQVFSSRLRVPAIVAVLLACSLGSAQAAVVFAESPTASDFIINTVVGSEFPTHYFTVSAGGMYRATITDLSAIDSFFDPSSKLAMKIADSSLTTFRPPGPSGVGILGGTDFVDFPAPAAGTFAALVKATSGGAGTLFSGYQVRVTLIPEPALWVLLAAGFGLLGFVRIRRAAHNGI